MKIKLSELKEHPDNDKIYSPTNLSELEQSILDNGLIEPIVITKKKVIISGHRRYNAMKNLGIKECEYRYITTKNEVITLIEANKQRQKTATDILNESRYLEKELKDYVGRGRNATKRSLSKKRDTRTTTILEMSKRLEIGATQLKQLYSIKNYEPELIKDIDEGKISVSKAYKSVQEKYISKKYKRTEGSEFEKSFKKLLKKEQPEISDVNAILKETYPYCLSLTGISESQRQELINHFEELRKYDSEELIRIQKSDELSNLKQDKKLIKECQYLIPSYKEVDDFMAKTDLSDIEIHPTSDKKIDNKGNILSFQHYSIYRTRLSNHIYRLEPGRGMQFFVGFRNRKGFRLLGIISLNSDYHALKAREEHIGWSNEVRAKNREHLVNLSTLVPTQPFGFNYLGTKFMALIATRTVKFWEERYKQKVIAFTTTSLHGSTSAYQGMNFYAKHIGSTSGNMNLIPTKKLSDFWFNWFQVNFEDRYNELKYSSSPYQRQLVQILRILGIDTKRYQHNHRKGMFIMPLYDNYKEFLRGEIRESKLKKKELTFEDWYLPKAMNRHNKLVESKRKKTTTLFHDSNTMKGLSAWLFAKGLEFEDE